MRTTGNYAAFYRLIYDTIGGLTPLDYDCGSLCGKACCKGEENGMLLFPHEEEALDLSAYTVNERDGLLLLRCDGRCERENRPLACRIFPFFPTIMPNGRIAVRPEAGAFKLCPCLQHIDCIRFDKLFLRSVRRVGRLLSIDDDCRAFLTERGAENEPLLHMILPEIPRSLIRR